MHCNLQDYPEKMEPLETAKLNADYIKIVSFYPTENKVFLCWKTPLFIIGITRSTITVCLY